MKSIIRENTWLSERSSFGASQFGWGNGYVVIPIGHELHNIPYGDINVEVHYGLTYGCIVTEHSLKQFPELTDNDLGSYMIGFDTAHSGDSLERWPKERVQEETTQLLFKLMNNEYSYYKTLAIDPNKPEVQTFTIEQIRKYIESQDSLGDVLHYLSEEKILEANEPAIPDLEYDDSDDHDEQDPYYTEPWKD